MELSFISKHSNQGAKGKYRHPPEAGGMSSAGKAPEVAAQKPTHAGHVSANLEPLNLSRSSAPTSCVERLLIILSFILVFCFIPFSLCFCFQIVQEYQRAVIFRMGKIRAGGARGPGLFFILPCTDEYRKVDLRTVSFDVDPQEVLTKDSVTVAVDAVVYYRVRDPLRAVIRVADYCGSTRLLAATTLRNVLGTRDLSELLAERDAISHTMQCTLDDATGPWGVEVERVEIKDVRLPIQLQKAMAAEAEAKREARAKIIAAEGEIKASQALKEASMVMMDNPMALQLRYLQSLNAISSDKSSTIVFPFPIEMLQSFLPR